MSQLAFPVNLNPARSCDCVIKDHRNAGPSGIYLASDERYTEAELPASFGPKTGTPEQGIDHTFVLCAGSSRQP